jgi:hypothetical protein
MDQQLRAGLVVGGVLTRAEHDVSAHRICLGLHRAGRLRRHAIDVYPDLAEIVPETLLHVLPQSRRERSSWAGQRVVDTDWRRVHRPGRLPRQTLNPQWCAATRGRRRHSRNVIGDLVRFLFVAIPRLVHRELRLETPPRLGAARLAFVGPRGHSAAGALALHDSPLPCT